MNLAFSKDKWFRGVFGKNITAGDMGFVFLVSTLSDALVQYAASRMRSVLAHQVHVDPYNLIPEGAFMENNNFMAS